MSAYVPGNNPVAGRTCMVEVPSASILLNGLWVIKKFGELTVAVTLFNLPGPLLVMVILCEICGEYPAFAMGKLIEFRFIDQTGGGVTVKDSGISLCTGSPFVEDIRSVPVWVPIVKPDTGRTCIVEVAPACTVVDGLWVI